MLVIKKNHFKKFNKTKVKKEKKRINIVCVWHREGVGRTRGLHTLEELSSARKTLDIVVKK